MAKSKELKKQEAIERKRESYFEKALMYFVASMPGGDDFRVNEKGLETLEGRTGKMIRMAKEAMVSFDGTPVLHNTTHTWEPTQAIKYYLAHDNYLQLLKEAQSNFNELFNTGEIPFQPNRQRFDSDMEKLRKAFEV